MQMPKSWCKIESKNILWDFGNVSADTEQVFR